MARLHLKDINCLAYLQIVLVFILLFRNNIEKWEIHSLLHFILTGIILFISLFKPFKKRKLWLFIQIFYPVAIVFFSWVELRSLGQIIPFRHDLTPFIIRAEACLFGLENLKSFRRSLSPFLDELMNFFYFSYYLILPLATVPLFVQRKIDATASIIFLITLTYFSNFLFFYFFPCLSPNYLNLDVTKDREGYGGRFFNWLNDFIQTREGVKGAAFPSSHLSAVTALTLASWRYNKLLGLVFSFLVALMGLSAVYLGYHHGLDCLAGLFWGGLCFWLGLRLLKMKKMILLS